MRFLCDQMLAGLGRWLRTAGHDTEVIAETLSDREILDFAVAEGRMLLTRDRHFLQMPEGKDSILYLQGNSIEECIGELNKMIHVDWLYAPFTRCLLCNSLLIQAEEAWIQQQVPEGFQTTSSQDFWACAHCKKAYWLGSHTDAMLKQLEVWNQL